MPTPTYFIGKYLSNANAPANWSDLANFFQSIKRIQDVRDNVIEINMGDSSIFDTDTLILTVPDSGGGSALYRMTVDLYNPATTYSPRALVRSDGTHGGNNTGCYTAVNPPLYATGTTYSDGNVVRSDGTHGGVSGRYYISQDDDNVGHNLNNLTWWVAVTNTGKDLNNTEFWRYADSDAGSNSYIAINAIAGSERGYYTQYEGTAEFEVRFVNTNNPASVPANELVQYGQNSRVIFCRTQISDYIKFYTHSDGVLVEDDYKYFID